ncbi:MAG: glycosyltransferase family 4 protein [Acidimicrobiia bacterium]|nr:glycosyltransferase family 4 protein [Acidimicrobiia bacterium]
MRVLVAHNYYRQRGGEDQVFEDEVDLLRRNGHDVETFVRHNHDFSGLQTISVAAGTVWNRSAARAIEEQARAMSAEVVHFHNWLPQISMAAFASAHRSGAAVVQTIHNYRYTCASGVLYRDGEICEACLGKAVGTPAVKYGCYRDSRVATIPLVTALGIHRAKGTTAKYLDAVIMLTEFAQTKLSDSGLPTDRMYIKPNFVSPDPGEGSGAGGYVAFVGRLIDNKGIEVLLDAWSTMPTAPTLRIAGAGPMEVAVQASADALENVEYLGRIDGSAVSEFLGHATASVVPSLNYEGFPKTVVESYAVGTPVIASRIGSLIDIVTDGETAFHFEPGDTDGLRAIVGDPATWASLGAMRPIVRGRFESELSADANIGRLVEIYDAAIRHRHA